MTSKEALAEGTTNDYVSGEHQLPRRLDQGARAAAAGVSATSTDAAAAGTDADAATTAAAASAGVSSRVNSARNVCPFCGKRGHKTRRSKHCLEHNQFVGGGGADD